MNAESRAIEAARAAGAVVGAWRHGHWRQGVLRAAWPHLARRLDELDQLVGADGRR